MLISSDCTDNKCTDNKDNTSECIDVNDNYLYIIILFN